MVNRGEEKVRVHMNVVPRSTTNSSPTFSVRPRSSVGRSSNGRSNPEVVGSIPTEVKRIFSLPRVVP